MKHYSASVCFLFLAFVGYSLDCDFIELVFPRNTGTGDPNRVSIDIVNCIACSVTQSSLTLCNTIDCSPSVHGDSPGKNTGISTLCSVVTAVGRKDNKEGIYVYAYTKLVHFAVQQKHNIVKQLYSKKKKKM